MIIVSVISVIIGYKAYKTSVSEREKPRIKKLIDEAKKLEKQLKKTIPKLEKT
ncbi:unnamed protein product [marine sediment metagenome]|uniref:Uncharacterized protein n=1 Tax=marine sediment metagenome TaxID=412755 RepID=X1H930_9ZZZZ